MQPTLFDLPPRRESDLPADITISHHRGNPESMETNANLQPRKSELRERIYRWYLRRGQLGAVAEEAELDMGFARGTAQPRITELKAMKRLVKTGERRLTSTGNPAAVLVADVYAEKKEDPNG